MRFSSQRVAAYGREYFVAEDLDALGEGDGRPPLAVSGVEDYREALAMTSEWYDASFPQVTFKELALAPGSVDPVYNEPTSGHKDFSRVLDVPAKLAQEKVSIKRGREGPIREQVLVAHVGVGVLARLDYWPRTGDEVVYRGVLHEVGLVSVEPSDYWQQTGWPLHIRIDLGQVHLGDWQLPGLSHTHGSDTGAGEVPAAGSPGYGNDGGGSPVGGSPGEVGEASHGPSGGDPGGPPYGRQPGTQATPADEFGVPC